MWLAELSQTRGYEQILRSVGPFLERVATARDTQDLGRLLQDAVDHVTYSVDRESQAVLSVVRLVPKLEQEGAAKRLDAMIQSLRRFGEEQTDRMRRAIDHRGLELGLWTPVKQTTVTDILANQASRIVVKRKRFGTLPLDDLPTDQREGYPSGAWESIPTTALYWCDGHRNLAEVIHLTRMELGPTDFDFVGYFRFLRKHGYVEFLSE